MSNRQLNYARYFSESDEIKYIVTKKVSRLLQNRKFIHFTSQQQQFKPYGHVIVDDHRYSFYWAHYATK